MKWTGITVLILLLISAATVAAVPSLRQSAALLWSYNANSFASVEWLAETKSKTISFYYDRHILVPAVFQKQRDLLLALDTGAPMSALITGKHTDGLTIQKGAEVPIGGSGEGVSPRANIIDGLELLIGPIQFSNFTALLIPWEQMGEFFSSPDQVYIHGFLGYDLFNRFVVKFDFVNEKLTLIQPEEFEYNGTGAVIPLTYSQRKPYIQAEITQRDGQVVPVKLQVDLGKPSTLSLIPSAKAGISIPPNAVENESRGLSGRSEERLARLSSLRIGKYELKDVTTSFSIQGFATSAERNGVLGLDVLSRFDLIVDYPRNRLILEPVDLDGRFEADMSGIRWVPDGSTFTVRHIRQNSPADRAGIKVGDKLIAFDDVPAESLRFGELVELTRTADGRGISLKLARDQTVYITNFELNQRI